MICSVFSVKADVAPDLLTFLIKTHGEQFEFYCLDLFIGLFKADRKVVKILEG